MTRNTLKTTALLLTAGFAAAHTDAAIVATLDMTTGAQTVDTTTTSYVAWGYAGESLLDTPTWDNTKSGGAVLAMSQSGLTDADRDYGHRFTFNDGTSPASDTDVATSGNVASLNSSDTLTFSLDGVVSTTEQTLTLYLGTYGAGGTATVSFVSTLTGGTLDESSSSASTPTASGTTPGTYTVTFSSATETDLDIAITFSDAGGGTRNFGVSGYTLTAVPEPSSLALIGLGGLCLVRRRR